MPECDRDAEAAELRELSAGWEYSPPEWNEWCQREAARIGVTPEQLRKAFSKEIEQRKELHEPLQVPDCMRITHRYSYGGQSPFFRALRDYGKLLGARCPSCEFVYCPPRRHCSRCYGRTQWVELPGTGRIETFTTVHIGTSLSSGRVPFVCAYVRLDGSDFVLCTNVEMDDISLARPGLPVRAMLRPLRTGRITDIYFVPV